MRSFSLMGKSLRLSAGSHYRNEAFSKFRIFNKHLFSMCALCLCMCCGTCVEVTGHLAGVVSLTLPCGFQRWHSGCQAWHFTHRHFAGPDVTLSILLHSAEAFSALGRKRNVCGKLDTGCSRAVFCSRGDFLAVKALILSLSEWPLWSGWTLPYPF